MTYVLTPDIVNVILMLILFHYHELAHHFSSSGNSVPVWIRQIRYLRFPLLHFPFSLFFFFCTRNWRQRLLFMYYAWTVAENFDFSAIFSTSVSPCTVHRTHKFHFSATFSSKMGPTVLFTYFKIILLQYFQFSVFSFSKISSIQTDPLLLTLLMLKMLWKPHKEVFIVIVYSCGCFLVCTSGPLSPSCSMVRGLAFTVGLTILIAFD